LKLGARYLENIAGVCGDLVLTSPMSKGALFLALGLLGVCFPVVAQQARHSRATQHPAATSAVTPLAGVSSLSLYWPKILSAPNHSILFHNGPVRAWSDGAQLASETALAQIGMAPLGLFPVAYLAPSYVAPVPATKPAVGSNSRAERLASDGKDLPSELMSPPANRVYYTGEVGFLYGQWSGKGSGDYLESYVWGQAGNDKFQITAGAAFENWDGRGAKLRAYPYSK
jgi:hypothetical protein